MTTQTTEAKLPELPKRRAYSDSCFNEEDMRSYALAAIEADRNKRAEPVALTDYHRIMLKSCADWLDARSNTVWAEQSRHQHLMREYADDIRSLLASAQQVAPEGYVLVPVEPTEEMCAELARLAGIGMDGAHWLLTCVLNVAAAPQPEQKG